MTRGFSNRVARLLATFLMVLLMNTPAQAETLALPQSGADPVTLALSDSAAFVARSSELLEVFVGAEETCCRGRTPIAGHYAETGRTLAFAPVFGFEPGQDYVARIRTKDGETLIPFSIPTAGTAVPAAVTHIFPSGDTLPENVLRFYIHFSVPMKPHIAFDHIKLRDASGTVDEAAFMRFKQELWNEDRTRLTVLFDPGRIKRQVATNVALGPALRAGQSYTISVDGGWPTADGSSVLPAFTKAFEVSKALRARPDTRLWAANAPCAGTRDPLTISFDRPFDRHLLPQALRLETGAGLGLDGDVQIGDREIAWRFTPHQPWPEEDLTLLANPVLEDVAGNNFLDLLDHVAGPQDVDPLSTNLPISVRACSG